MALNTGKILMRRGQEVNFDPNKMMPGEWAVSLDSKFVRMCFSPGVCIRMATYEAFEADMEQIKAILAEAKTVQSAVIRINNEVSDKLDAVVEYAGQAKTYRDQALQYRNDAERFRNEAQQVAGGNFLTPESAVSFTEATSRSNITTTDTVSIILGKIKKFFNDLKPHAFNNPTNNLLATVAGTPLDAVQGKVLYDRDVNMSVGRLVFQNKIAFGTLEEFVQETAKDITTPIIMRVRDTTGAWGPVGSIQWYKCFVVYQNPYGNQYSLGGAGFMWDDAGNKWSIEITGNSNTTINFKHEKLITETELNNKVPMEIKHFLWTKRFVITFKTYHAISILLFLTDGIVCIDNANNVFRKRYSTFPEDSITSVTTSGTVCEIVLKTNFANGLAFITGDLQSFEFFGS